MALGLLLGPQKASILIRGVSPIPRLPFENKAGRGGWGARGGGL